MRSLIARAATSDPPPGGYGTTILIGRAGFHCAWAGSAAPTASASTNGHMILFMVDLL
jgi:hypothetical protein